MYENTERGQDPEHRCEDLIQLRDTFSIKAGQQEKEGENVGTYMHLASRITLPR